MSDNQAGSNVAEGFIEGDHVAEAKSVVPPQASTEDDVEADATGAMSLDEVNDEIDEKGDAPPQESFAASDSVVKPMDYSR